MTAKKTKNKGKPKAKSKAKAPSKLKLLSEICKDLKVTDRTVRQWIKKGCPCKRIKKKGGGRARIWIDEGKLRDWIAANDIELKTLDGPSEASEGELLEPITEIKDSDASLPGLIGAVARLRNMERVAYISFETARASRESNDKLRAKEKLYIEAHEALRRTEKELPDILAKKGSVIPIETVLQEQAKIDLAVKNQFLTLPRKMAGELAAISDATEIEDRMQIEIDDCLRHIASGGILSPKKA